MTAEPCGAQPLTPALRRSPGVDAFILAGIPHLEEAYRVGEEVLPLLGRQVPSQVAPTERELAAVTA